MDVSGGSLARRTVPVLALAGLTLSEVHNLSAAGASGHGGWVGGRLEEKALVTAKFRDPS